MGAAVVDFSHHGHGTPSIGSVGVASCQCNLLAILSTLRLLWSVYCYDISCHSDAHLAMESDGLTE